jgi:hypothetical protein
MGLGDYAGQVVRRGKWLYDGTVPQAVDVVAFDCDFYFDRLPGDDGRPEWERYPLNEDGVSITLGLTVTSCR